jgi:anthranilate phosphoribosyltransferase
VEESAEIFKKVLVNTASCQQRDVVLCNAALAIQTVDQQKSFVDCYALAEESLAGGEALRSFQKLIAISN